MEGVKEVGYVEGLVQRVIHDSRGKVIEAEHVCDLTSGRVLMI